MTTPVRVLGGHFKGCVGNVEGYYYEKTIVTIPIKDVPTATVLLSTHEYETLEQEDINNVQS